MLCLSKTSVKRDEIVDGVLFAVHPGSDLGFYKGGCPIHLKGAPPSPPNYFDPCYRNQTISLALEEIVGARRSYDI